MREREINAAALPQSTELSPMDVGTIIKTAWQHYFSHFLQYLPLSLRGTVWQLVPSITLLVGLLWMLKQDLLIQEFSGPAALIIPAWIVLFLWCVAQSLGEFAGISRSVYQSLKSSETAPVEQLVTSRRYTHSRRFSLLGSAAIKTVILGLISTLFFVIFTIAFATMILGVGLFNSEPRPGLFFAGGGTAIVSFFLFVWLYAWLSLKLLLNEQFLAIEADSGAIASLGQSWKLMRKQLLRSLLIVFIAFLITLPIILLAAILAQFSYSFLLQSLGITTVQNGVMFEDLLPLAISYLVSNILALLGGIIVNPFFRTVLTTLYFDIRNRIKSI